MKTPEVVLLLVAVYGMIFSIANAADDVVKGRALFYDATFAGAASGKSCNFCHPNSKSLENAGDKVVSGLHQYKNKFDLAGKSKHIASG